jgi:DNA-binding transcriptional LysR family regulator
MNTEHLSLLLDVARRGSFAAVARERGLDPSSVSRTIAELEEQLGIRLFQRSTRRMSLTEAGDIYVAQIEPLVAEFERARDMAASAVGDPRGLLRITASETFGHMRIVPLLKEFRQRYPLLQIEGLFTDANLDLFAERIDLAVRLAPAVEGNLIVAKLMDTHYRVVASPAYLAAHAPIRGPDDMASHEVLLFTLRAFRTRWIFRDATGSEREVRIRGSITLSPAGSLRRAALNDLGPALLPDWLVDEDVARGDLVNLFPHWRVTATTFNTAAWLVYPSRSYLPNKVRVAIDFLRQKFG